MSLTLRRLLGVLRSPRVTLPKTEQLGTAWPVYRDFEVEDKDGDVYVYAPFRPPKHEAGQIISVSSLVEEDLGLERVYVPLRDQPDLFLRFSSLARKGGVSRDEALQIMLDWVTSYGVLGLEDIDKLEIPGRWAHRMGRRESLVHFNEAVRKAAWCLTLYEAATAPGGPNVQALDRVGVRGDKPEKNKGSRFEVSPRPGGQPGQYGMLPGALSAVS